MFCVSIPQAVSTIAILADPRLAMDDYICFNTASGKYYCNARELRRQKGVSFKFQYRKR